LPLLLTTSTVVADAVPVPAADEGAADDGAAEVGAGAAAALPELWAPHAVARMAAAASGPATRRAEGTLVNGNVRFIAVNLLLLP
jgi:hypothetical protein